MKYKIVTEISPYFLSLAVNDEIERGWKPQGGVAITKSLEEEYQAKYMFAQAMVKEEA